MWGNVRFTRDAGLQRPRLQWQVTCPFCLAIGSTQCTRTLIVEADGDEEAAVDSVADLKCRRRLEFWVVHGVQLQSKRKHQDWEGNGDGTWV